jgi:hypothetical protein
VITNMLFGKRRRRAAAEEEVEVSLVGQGPGELLRISVHGINEFVDIEVKVQDFATSSLKLNCRVRTYFCF